MKKTLMMISMALMCHAFANAQAYKTTFDNYFNTYKHLYNNELVAIVGCRDGILYTYESGGKTVNSIFPVASISKWVTSAIIMMLVEEGKFGIDDKASDYIPSFDRPDKENITIRQLLAHTSGLPVDNIGWDDGGQYTLDSAVNYIATNQLLFQPGQGFKYGTTAYKVASRVAEIKDGKPWKDIFTDRLKNVCGMPNSVYNPLAINNPSTGAGLETSASEYANFLQMILRYGMHNSTRVMDSTSIVEMEAESAQDGGPISTYGLGVWREAVNSNGIAKELMHPGATGTLAWIDRNKNIFGVILSAAGFTQVNVTNQNFRGLVSSTLTGTECGSSNPGGENPCNYVDKQTVGTWNGLNVQTRKYTVNGTPTWLIVTAVSGSATDKHFPRGKNFADRTDINWSITINKSCLGGGNTDWGGLSIPSGITVPSGYVQATEPDGAVYFYQSTPPQNPTFSQCLESELQTGTGAVTSDPNASNGETRGEQNNYNHYVDYAITGVPAAGTYYVTLRYYSSAAPTISVQVGSGTPQTINLANSGSWNIVWATHQFSVNLKAGNNTLRISGTGGGSCRQDRICVSHTSGSPVVLEPETFAESQLKQFVVSPNPSRGAFETQFYLERGKKASIIINDLQGRVIFNKQVIGNGGLHKERINLNNKVSGMLLMQLKTDKGVELKKINIAR